MDHATRSVTFKSWINWNMDVTFIGDKIYVLSDTISTDDGKLLGKIEMVYGDYNDDRKLDYISDNALLKREYLSANIKPAIPEVLDIPNDLQIYSLVDTVSKINIDENDHANFSYYIDLALKTFSGLENIGNKELNIFKEFGVVYKNECALGDVVKASAWNDADSQTVYCHLSNGSNLLAFVNAKLFEENSKL